MRATFAEWARAVCWAVMLEDVVRDSVVVLLGLEELGSMVEKGGSLSQFCASVWALAAGKAMLSLMVV